MYEKNGWPWAGMINTKLKASDSLVAKMIDLWNSTNWGDNFENYRRPDYQDAIYPDTGTRQLPNIKNDSELTELTNLAYSELQTIFSKDMIVYMSELNCLVPKGKIPWHHDRMSMCFYGTRIILPLFNVENIVFSFSSWNDNTPINSNDFSAKHFMDTDIVSLSVEPGYYYIFNHRVPHQTRSFSKKPRAMFSIDLVAESNIEKCRGSDNERPIFKEISQEEKTKIIPALL